MKGTLRIFGWLFIVAGLVGALDRIQVVELAAGLAVGGLTAGIGFLWMARLLALVEKIAGESEAPPSAAGPVVTAEPAAN